MCFSFCIDIFSKNGYKRKNVTPEHVLLAKLEEECQEKFDGEVEVK